MLTFRRFLIEVQRTPERASNLADYITKRQETTPDYSDTKDPNYDKKYSKQMKNPIKRHPHEDYEAEIEETGHRINPEEKTEMVPINKIVSPQKHVSVERVKEKIENKPKNQKPGTSILHNGVHILTDGNHSLAAAKLRGDTHFPLTFRKTSKIGN